MMQDRNYINRDKRKKLYDGDKPENMGKHVKLYLHSLFLDEILLHVRFGT